MKTWTRPSFLILLLAIVQFVQAQPDCETTTFQKAYGNSNENDHAHTIIETPDRGFIAAGWATPLLNHGMLMKVNAPKAQIDSSSIHAHTDSSLYKKMNSLKLSKYRGRSINYLLKNEVFMPFMATRYIDAGRIGVLDAVVLEYDKNTHVYIELKSFKHVNRVNKLGNWDFNLVKKEKIKSIEIMIYQPGP